MSDEFPSDRTERDVTAAEMSGPRVQPTAPVTDGTRYSPVRFHAAGGLGEVYLASDGELHRSVALKCLQARAGDDPVARRRFLREAEITGRLEHPGVVPVYGLLRTREGRPFYTMRFIEGETLHAAIRRLHGGSSTDRVAFRKLLQQFVQVCDTMAYAHSRGVLHRDLKPQNIMLGPFGEVLVVDWGLARIQGESGSSAGVDGKLHVDRWAAEDSVAGDASDSDGDSSATQVGSIVGTPAYMSPEQASGAVDELTPACDVFSLGAILYAILTGRPPYRSATAIAALDEARAVRMVRPRTLNATVPAALEGVCLKAMAIKPADRFASSRDLAAEVERWLADEPVASWREPWSARAWRWIRRHRTLVVGVMCLLLTAVAGLSIGLVAVHDEQRRTDERRRDAELARQQATASATSASEHRKLALQTLQSVIFDMQAQMRGRPGVQDLQQSLLLTAQRGLELLTKSVEASDEADRTKALALMQLGEVYQQYADVGGLSAARTQFERALQLYRRLRDATPDDRGVQRLLAECMLHLGDVALPIGQSAEAERFFRDAQDLVAGLVKLDPSDAPGKAVLADALQRVGDMDQSHGHPAEALAAYRESNRLCRELADAAPDDAGRQTALATSYERLARMLVIAGKELEAVPVYESQLAILDRLLKKGPATIPLRRDFAAIYQNLGTAYRQGGDVDKALENYRRAADLLLAIERDDPQFVAAHATAASTLFMLGYTEWLLGRLDEAVRDSQSALERFRNLIDADPRNLGYRAIQSRANVTLVNVWLQTGKTADAVNRVRTMRDSHRAVVEADPANVGLRIELGNSLNTYAIVMMFVNDLTEARQALAEGLELLRPLERSGAIAENGFARSILISLECKQAGLAGDAPATAMWAERLAVARGAGWFGPFHAACGLGWADKAVRRGRPPDQLSAAERRQLDEYARRAIEWLNKAAQSGLRNAGIYQRISDLEPFRSRPEFQSLMAKLGRSAPESP